LNNDIIILLFILLAIIMASGKYTTIPVLVHVKEKLDSRRGGLDWSEFLLKLLEENIMLKRIIAARRIQERFDSSVEKNVKESVDSMRKMSLGSKG